MAGHLSALYWVAEDMGLYRVTQNDAKFTSWVDFHFTQVKNLWPCMHDTNISASPQWIVVTHSWCCETTKTVPSHTLRITLHIAVVTLN